MHNKSEIVADIADGLLIKLDIYLIISIKYKKTPKYPKSKYIRNISL